MKASKSPPRVRWNAEESEKVLRRFADLRRTQPGDSQRQVMETAQELLPVERRRPVYPSLVSWANKAIVELKPVSMAAPPSSVGDAAASVDEALRATSATADTITSALIANGIRAGAAVLTGILKDAEVQRAVAELLADVLRKLATTDEPARLTGSSAEQDQPSVAILGLTEQQSSEFARAYRGLMTLRFDRGAGVTPALREAIAASDVVIAMDGSVGQEVSRLLHTTAPSYVRHTNGLAGLRTRLAELAMRSGTPGRSGAESSFSKRAK